MTIIYVKLTFPSTTPKVIKIAPAQKSALIKEAISISIKNII